MWVVWTEKLLLVEVLTGREYGSNSLLRVQTPDSESDFKLTKSRQMDKMWWWRASPSLICVSFSELLDELRWFEQRRRAYSSPKCRSSDPFGAHFLQKIKFKTTIMLLFSFSKILRDVITTRFFLLWDPCIFVDLYSLCIDTNHFL